MSKRIDETGKVYGMLKVLNFVDGTKKWLCACDCGRKKLVAGGNLRTGNVNSCGCSSKKFNSLNNKKHGFRDTPTYVSWASMLNRCRNKKSPSYRNYGGRGITYCKTWSNFENFLKDMGERPLGQSLDRIDVNGDYCLENCRWATPFEQARNRTNSKFVTMGKESKLLLEWCEEYKISEKTVRSRIKRGWGVERAIKQKVRT